MPYTKTNEYIEYLVNEYSDTIFRLAMSRTKNKENSEDVYQEVFLRLAKKIPEFENKEHEKAWIIKVTINCSKTMLSSKHLKNRSELSENVGADPMAARPG
ncbi:MAG: sigma-70 family RNA polymerase sigma factor [Oscillospiraceae bacterium]|nr:sigma-70 family RNA polymerase sigma factor [Oscillospiraceae bacterium]